MVESAWMYVVHAEKQAWLVDVMEEEGKIPVALKRVESPYCPRGKIFLLPDPEKYLNTLKPEPTWSDEALDFVGTWYEREFQRYVQEIVTKPLADPSSIVKIASVT